MSGQPFVVDDAGCGFIASHEGYVGHPYWPAEGGLSGLTVDPCLDLGQCSAGTLELFYHDVYTPEQIGLLEQCIGKKGADAAALAAAPEIRSIHISQADATRVLKDRLMPKFTAIAESNYPGLAYCPMAIRTALTDLCVNRGGIPLMMGFDGAESTDTDRYTEERAIRDAVATGGWESIPVDLRQMGDRVFAQMPGLRRRCYDRAKLIEDFLAAKKAGTA